MKETKFKQTEIGMIPDDWEVKELGKITTHVDYRGKTPHKTQQGIQLITAKNIRMGYIDYQNNQEFVSENDYYEVMKRGLPHLGDVLITTEAPAGNVAQIDRENIALAQRVIKYSGKDCICNDYLCKYFLSNYFQSLLKSMNTGGTVQGIKGSLLHTLPVILPPSLAEQQKIAKALSDVDNVISTLEKLITKKKNLKQGTMQQLLTGKKRLPGFVKTDKFKQTEIGEIPEDWEVKSFEELFDICTSTISLNFVKTAFYVGTENMLPNRGGVLNYENELNYLSVREYRKEDILFSNIRPYLKKLWLANHNGGCSTDVLVFRKKNKDDSALFLYMLISDDRFFQIVNDNAIGTKMPRGDKNIIKQIKFCLPSKLEQTAIANVLSSMDKEIEALEAKLGKYRDLKTGMMQQLLTGKIRLM